MPKLSIFYIVAIDKSELEPTMHTTYSEAVEEWEELRKACYHLQEQGLIELSDIRIWLVRSAGLFDATPR